MCKFSVMTGCLTIPTTGHLFLAAALPSFPNSHLPELQPVESISKGPLPPAHKSYFDPFLSNTTATISKLSYLP